MMGYEEKRVRALLREHKAVFVRQNKHEIWRLPCGLVTLPSTPSDYRAWKNALAFLHTALLLHDAERGKAGERREKRTTLFTRPMPETPLEAPKLSDMPTAMRSTIEAQRVKPHKAIKHPVHGQASPGKEFTVDVSGLLTKFGGAK